MFLQKVEHYLKFSFLLLLVFSQVLIFVAVRAKDNSNLIKASFVSPISGQRIKAGDFVELEAYLEDTEGVDFSSLYFTIENPASNYSQNFEANKAVGGTWRASSSWDTTTLPSGYYLLSVTADVYQNGELKKYYSQSQPFVVENLDYRAAIEVGATNNFVFSAPTDGQELTGDTLDILVSSESLASNVRFTIKEWDENQNVAGQIAIADIVAEDLGGGYSWGVHSLDITALANGHYAVSVRADFEGSPEGDPSGIISPQTVDLEQQVVFSINRPAEPIAISAVINSPTNSQTLSGALLLKATLNRALDPNNNEAAVAVKISDTDGNLISQINLEKDSSGLIYQQTIDTAFLGADDQFLYPDANYKCEFVVSSLESQNSVLSSLASVNIFIDNQEDELALSEQLVLNSPVLGTEIKDDSFIIDISTLLPFEGLKLQFYKTNDAAISSNVIDVPLVDGYHWVHTLTLDDSFGDGQYTLSVSLIDSEAIHSLGPLEYIFSLSRQGAETFINPDEIKLELFNLDGDISGIESPVVLSNFEFASGDVYLELNKSTNDITISPIPLIRASWSTLASLGFYQGDHSSTPYGYIASWDTANLENGNYNVVAKSSLNSNIASNSKLLSVFNTAEDIEDQPKESLVKIHNGFDYVDNGSRLVFYVMTDVDPIVLSQIYVENSKEELVKQDLPKVKLKWEEVPAFEAEDFLDTPHLWAYYLDISDDNSRYLADGSYSIYAKIFSDEKGENLLAQSTKFSFQIKNGQAIASNQGLDVKEEGVIVEQGDDKIQTSGAKIAIRLHDSCLDLGIDNDEDCARFRAMLQSFDKRCIDQSIFEAVACEDYLNRVEVDLECQEAAIIDREQCKDYLLEKYASDVNCQLEDSSSCSDTLRNYYLNRLVIAQKRRATIDQVLSPLIGTTVSTKELGDKLESFGLALDAISIKADIASKVFIAKSQKEAVLESDDVLTVLGQALMLIDSDGDFLPDDLEKYYGTDTENSDSDGDSYSDSVEIQNGYNPLGEGDLLSERLELDKILLAGEALEQPKFGSDKINNDLDLTDIENLQDRVRLRGQADPNTWLAIYLYSDLPMLMLAKTDDSGNWFYDIKQTISDGHHQVYVAVNDSNGKIISQSRPVSFLVKSSQAVSADDYFGGAITQAKVDRSLVYYIGGAALLLIIVLIVVIFLYKNKNRGLRA